MPQCPNCHTEVKAEERFCPNCGTRLEQSAPPPANSAVDISKPDRSASPPAGNQTIVLPAATNVGKTQRLPESQPSPTVRLPEPPTPPARPPENQPPARSAVDATIVAGMPAPPPTSPASDATFVGNPGQPASPSGSPAFGPPSLPPTRPASDATYVGDPRPPSAPGPAAGGPQVGGPTYSGGTLPPASVAPQQAGKTGGARLWKILAIVAGLGVLACVALIAGVLWLAGETSSTTKPTAAAAKPTGVATPKPKPTSVASGGNPLAVEIGDLETYTYDTGLFSIDVPNNWTIEDQSKSGEAILVWTDPSGYAQVQIELFKSANKQTDAQLVTLLQKSLEDTFGANEAFNTGDPLPQDDGSVLIVWSYTDTSQGVDVELTGNSFVEQRGDKISILTTVVPSEQFNTLLDSTNDIIRSYKINPSSALP